MYEGKTIIFLKIYVYKQKTKQVLLAAQVYVPNMFGRKLAAPHVPTHPPIYSGGSPLKNGLCNLWTVPYKQHS